MAVSMSRLDELIALRAREREEAQRDHLRAMTGRLDEALGPRVLEALDPGGEGGWEAGPLAAARRFVFRNTEYHLAVHAPLGAPRVEVELRHADLRFNALAKKTALQDVDEDWFLANLETLAGQVRDRLVNPRNFT
ncbi:hypothetical protein [Mesoterricola sediminis]|uniref:Uncharacterized protein n=1 Tax=Mesoterricola sediminis TaxID=2927980 RepID=A0AA48KD32_9BACT|nr:hypothetical protein [Mesoterricola sediminis]BDU77809.1 hypothetical protein METESE_27670 [Mesoterricola sediminis]